MDIDEFKRAQHRKDDTSEEAMHLIFKRMAQKYVVLRILRTVVDLIHPIDCAAKIITEFVKFSLLNHTLS